MSIIDSADTFEDVVERYAPDGDEIEVLVMETDEMKIPTDPDYFAPVGEFEDHTDFPLHPPSTGRTYDYIVARGPYDGEPSLGDNLRMLNNEDFANDPPDWYERELPEWLGQIGEE